MTNTNDELKELKRKLKEHETYLNEIEQGIKNLKSENRTAIQTKEKELESWRNKLEILQQEKKQIDKEIKEKVLELEKSNLENAEKQSKINKLLTEHGGDLEELDKLLYDERSQYRQIRDKIFEMILKPCPTCLEKDRHIRNSEDRISNLKIASILLLLSAVFWCFLFL